ncbi:MAG: hypothetical protein U0228_07960 [Myxococcaceae bacterium]
MTTQPAIDGRTARAHEGRRKVGEALLGFVREQGALPDVETLARRAGVARRSVFRYFDGTHALELETARLMRERLTRVLPLPAPRGGLDERLDALLTHRTRLYETVTPVRVFLEAAATRGTPGVRAFLDEAGELLRENLQVMLAPELRARPRLVTALEWVTSWEAWHALRERQGCARARARREVERLVRALLASRR